PSFERDAADQRTGGLHLVRDDGDLGADQCIEQRRLAGIGRADQRDEAAARIAFWLGVLNHRACPPPRRRASTWRPRRPVRRPASMRPCPRPAAGRAAPPRRGIPDRDAGRCAPIPDRPALAARAPAPILAAWSWGRATAAAA